MKKNFFHKISFFLQGTTYWRQSTMIISFFMVLLATFFIILLSRAIDKELSFYGYRSEFQQETKSLLTHIIEMDFAVQNLKKEKTEISQKFLKDAHSNVLLSMKNLQKLSPKFPEIQYWLTNLSLYINTRLETLSLKDTIQSREQTHDNLIHLLRIISKSLKNNFLDLSHNHYDLDLLRTALSFAAIIACISTFLLAFIIYERFQRDMKMLQKYQKKLKEDNATLEKRVELRTKELKEAQIHAERERKRAEILLQDASHRVGNSLAIVSSLLNLQAGKSLNNETKTALLSARDRIQNIATTHRRLRLGKDGETTSIDELLSFIIEDIKMDLPEDIFQKISINYDIEPWQIKARDATTLGILMSEFLINAIKYAFPDQRSGKIFIKFYRDCNGILTLSVEDNGRGIQMPSKNNAKAQGLGHIIANQLCSQFGSHPYQETPEGGGTRFIIPLPALSNEAFLKMDKNNVIDNEGYEIMLSPSRYDFSQNYSEFKIKSSPADIYH